MEFGWDGDGEIDGTLDGEQGDAGSASGGSRLLSKVREREPCPLAGKALPRGRKSRDLFLGRYCNRCLFERMGGKCPVLEKELTADEYAAMVVRFDKQNATCPDCHICPYSSGSQQCPMEIDKSTGTRKPGSGSGIEVRVPRGGDDVRNGESQADDVEDASVGISPGGKGAKRGRHGEEEFRHWCTDSGITWCFSNNLVARVLRRTPFRNDLSSRSESKRTTGSAALCLSKPELGRLRGLVNSGRIEKVKMALRSRRNRCFPGLPDYFCFSTENPSNHFFAEIKFGGAVLSPVQKEVIGMLALTFTVHVVRVTREGLEIEESFFPPIGP